MWSYVDDGGNSSRLQPGDVAMQRGLGDQAANPGLKGCLEWQRLYLQVALHKRSWPGRTQDSENVYLYSKWGCPETPWSELPFGAPKQNHAFTVVPARAGWFVHDSLAFS